jgi:hypothetical protein
VTLATRFGHGSFDKAIEIQRSSPAFNKVRGEWSLMALCYNLTRVLNILGLEHFMARIANAISWLRRVLPAFQSAIRAFWSPTSLPLVPGC